MVFGTTVVAATNKPNKALSKYQAKATSYDGLTKADNTNVGRNMAGNQTQSMNPMSSGGGGTAASGRGSNVPTSPALQNLISNPMSQQMLSGNLDLDRSDPAYARLNKINETTDILNEGTNQKIQLANSLIRRRNAGTQQQATYDAGFNDAGGGESFGIGGIPQGLNAEQMSNAKLMADIGKQRGLDDNAIKIAIMTSLAESEMKNIKFGDRDSQGLFQQRPSQGWGSVAQVTNPNYAINKFYSALQGTANWQKMQPWQAAQAVQRSFDPSGGNYRARFAVAQSAFNALRSTPNGMQILSKANPQAAQFIKSFNNRYIDYDGAFGNQCVDLYNYFTKFIGGTNIMVGWAPEIYNAYDTKAYARTGANVRGQQGYVALFKPGGSTPSGHVAIVVGDNGNGTLRVLHSNATPAGSRGNTTISNISKSSLMGYLVPRKLYGGL